MPHDEATALEATRHIRHGLHRLMGTKPEAVNAAAWNLAYHLADAVRRRVRRGLLQFREVAWIIRAIEAPDAHDHHGWSRLTEHSAGQAPLGAEEAQLTRVLARRIQRGSPEQALALAECLTRITRAELAMDPQQGPPVGFLITLGETSDEPDVSGNPVGGGHSGGGETTACP